MLKEKTINNIIIYAFHVADEKVNDNYCFQQLKKSLKTLREYNKDINVKVYISPENVPMEFDPDLDLKNTEIIRFTAYKDPRLKSKVYAPWQTCKWQAAIECFDQFDCDNILHVDADTFFQENPEFFFDLYGNTEYVYGRKDIDLSDLVKMEYPSMNDGVWVVSKKTRSYLQDALNYRIDYIYKMQEKFKDFPDPPGWKPSLKGVPIIKVWWAQYLSGQYGIAEYFEKIGKPLKIIDNKHVYEVFEYEKWRKMSNEEKKSFSIVHYLNPNTMHFDRNAFPYYSKNFLSYREDLKVT